MKKIKFSIIVPIYNVEKYVEECIKSLVNQSYKNTEIILLNDGTQDNSFELCKKYAESNENIVLVDKQNEGVSKTRNRGIDIARGEYIIFVDSDDSLELKALEKIEKVVLSDGLTIFGYNKIYKDKKDHIYKADLQFNDITQVEKMIFESELVGGYLFNKVFSRKIIKDHNLKFNPNIHYCEDLLFVCEYLQYCHNFNYISKGLYNYRMRRSSVTYNYITKKNTSILKSYEILLQKYKKNKLISNNLKYRYLVSYYKLKSVIDNTIEINKEVLSDEKNIIDSQNLSIKELLLYKFIKKYNKLYLIAKKIKNKKLKLYE